MATTNYYSIHGQIMGEKAAGSSRVDYLTDALGSVTATVDQSANVVNTYRYKPYGGLLAKTGVGSDPAFLWVGSQGYRSAGKSYSDVYVRARHYSSGLGRWAHSGLQKHKIGSNNHTYVKGQPVILTERFSFNSLTAVSLKVTILPINRPVPVVTSDCGGARFGLKWAVFGRQTGFLIQHVTWSEFAYTCSLFPTPLNFFTEEYWEYWKFRDGVIDNGDISQDPVFGGEFHDQFAPAGYGEFTSGNIMISGKLKWYRGDNPPPADWRRGGEVGHGVSSGGLNWTRRIPGWIDPSHPSPPHGLTVGWHCCPNVRFTTQPTWNPRGAPQWWKVEELVV